MNLVFAGTPEFAAVALCALHSAGFPIPLVLTQPDRPAGRGMQLHASPVKQTAIAFGIPVAQPVSLRLDGKYPEEAAQAHAQLRDIRPDVMVVAAYGLILPPSILGIPKHGCINIHASLLPRWRGAAPIHRAIEAGDDETGITIMQMDQGLDTGPMLRKQSMAIAPLDTTGSLHDRLASLGGAMIVEVLRDLEQGALSIMPQPDAGVTYASKIGKAEALLDFGSPADIVARKIRAFNPFPGTSARFNSTNLKLWRAEEIPGPASAEPGRVLQAGGEGIVVACGSGAVRLLELQKPGGKRLPASEFLKGFAMQDGCFQSVESCNDC